MQLKQTMRNEHCNKKNTYFIVRILILLSVFLFSALIVLGATSPWSQNDWSGGGGQIEWLNPAKFYSSSSIDYSNGLSISSERISPLGTNRPEPIQSEWQYRKKISFDNRGISENLINFPVGISLTTLNFDFSKVQQSGNDIRFFDSDGTTPIKYEVEIWDAAKKQALIWINVPKIDASSSSDFIYMYYGNPSATSGQNREEAWNSNFVGVWHLQETSGNYGDSTSYRANSISITNITRNPDGRIDQGASFSGIGSHIDIGDKNQLEPQRITLEAWVKTNDFNRVGNGGIAKGQVFPSGMDGSYSLDFSGHTYGPTASWRLTNTKDWIFGAVTAPNNDNNFHYWVGVYDGTSSKLYKDGVLVGSKPVTDTIGYAKKHNSFTIGGANWGQYSLNGKIDEVRVSNIARSANWIKAQYKSMAGQFAVYHPSEKLAEEKQQQQGVLTSSIFDTGQSSQFGKAAYSSSTPSGTSAQVKIRTSNSSAMSGAKDFSTCNPIASNSDISSNNCVKDTHRYVQYQVTLNSEGAVSPSFRSFSLLFSSLASPPAPFCGDGSCNGNENYDSCPQDCSPPAPFCGDGSCNGNENSQTCPQDCGGTKPPIKNGETRAVWLQDDNYLDSKLAKLKAAHYNVVYFGVWGAKDMSVRNVVDKVHSYGMDIQLWEANAYGCAGQWWGCASKPNWYARLPNGMTRREWVGAENWIDFGIPEAKQFAINYMVAYGKNYNADGVHYDYIRYDSFATWSYSDYNLQRFKTLYGIEPSIIRGDKLPVISYSVKGNRVQNPTTAKVLATFQDSKPAILINNYKNGQVLTFNYYAYRIPFKVDDDILKRAINSFGGKVYVVYAAKQNDGNYNGYNLATRWLNFLGYSTSRISADGIGGVPSGSTVVIPGVYSFSSGQISGMDNLLSKGGNIIFMDGPVSSIKGSGTLRAIVGASGTTSFLDGRALVTPTSDATTHPLTAGLVGSHTLTWSQANNYLDKWENYMQSTIDDVLKSVSDQLKAYNPNIVISAAVFSPEDQPLRVHQNWPSWIQKGYVNYVVLMSYTLNSNVYNARLEWLKDNGFTLTAQPGMGTYLPTSCSGVSVVVDQVKLERSKGFKGFSIFESNDMTNSGRVAANCGILNDFKNLFVRDVVPYYPAR